MCLTVVGGIVTQILTLGTLAEMHVANMLFYGTATVACGPLLCAKAWLPYVSGIGITPLLCCVWLFPLRFLTLDPVAFVSGLLLVLKVSISLAVLGSVCPNTVVM